VINLHALLYAAGVAGVTLASRVWVRFRQDRRARRDAQKPLFDAVLLEVALTPREGDDPDILVEMRQTLTHLNRRSFAKEFWGLGDQLASYYERLPEGSQPTMRRAVLRLIEQPDRWLQRIGATTAARLNMAEAAPALRRTLAALGTAAPGTADARFRDEIAAAISQIAAGSAAAACDGG